MTIHNSLETRKMIKFLALFVLFSLVAGDTSSEVEGTSVQLETSSEIDEISYQEDATSEVDRISKKLRDSDRIIGGIDIGIEDVPYQISLRYRGKHHCGGSIISSEWVVTAAHCVNGLRSSDFTVRAGTSNKDIGGSLHAVSKIVSHSRYSANIVPVHDIALVKVRQHFVFDETRKPIALNNNKSAEYKWSTVSGWGTISNGQAPRILQVAMIPTVPKSYCAKSYKDQGGLPAGQICAGFYTGGKDACQGDSGGPLAIDDVLYGIVSWGIGCGLPNRPGVYTEVAAYRTFIERVTGV